MSGKTEQGGNQAQLVGGVLQSTGETIWNQEPYMEWLQTMMDDIPGGICVLRWVDGHLEPLVMSREFSRILQVEGDPKQNIYSMKQILYIHPEDQIRLDQYILECIQNNTSADITIRFQYDPQKEYRWINIQGNIVDQNDGTKLCYVACHDVSRERALASQLKSTDDHFQAALENTNIYSGRYDVREHIFYFNRRIQEDFGLPERLGENDVLQFHVITEEYRQSLRDLFQTLCTDKRDVMTIEMPIQNIHGEQVWVRQIYTVVERDNRQLPLTIISTALDITEHRQKEQRFNAENAYHQIMTKNTYSILYIDVTQWKVLDCIGEIIESVCDSDDLMLSLQDTIPDVGMRNAFQRIFNRTNMLREVSSGKNKLSYTFRSRRVSGNVIWMEITADMMQQGDGKVLALIQIKDINHQMIVDQVRNSMIDRFVDFVAYYVLADGSSYILSENQEYRFDSDEGRGALQKLSQHIRDKISPQEWENIQNQLNSKVMIEHLNLSSNYQYTFQEENGSRIKRVNYYYLDQNKDVIVISQQDITDLVREEVRQKEELQRALNIATHASNTRDDFLSNMSHDLRTPLNGIIGAAELAKKMVVSHPYQATEYLNDIYSSGHFMLNLVNDILEMSQLELGKQELEKVRIDWSIFSKDLRQMFEPICRERGLKMRIDLEDMPAVLGDSFQLRRILQNLLSNAVKFTKSGGVIECSVAESRMVQDTFLTTIMVRDNGVGMGEEFQKHMYETFSRESNEINSRKMGSGFGLAIASSLVELMDGFIHCESEQGVGTTFYVSLSFELDPESGEQQKRKRVPVEKKILRGCKVLLVEDHPLNAKIVTRLLESKEIIVDHAVNGQEAVDFFRDSELFYYDIILMDISMPVMDGMEATRQIRAMKRSDAHMVPIIALTANAFEKDIQKSKVAGMNEHLTKPLDSGKLFKTLIEYWQQA